MALPAPLTAAELAARLRLSGTLAMDPDVDPRLLGYQEAARWVVAKAAPSAPEVVSGEAILRLVAYWNDQPSATDGAAYSNAFLNSGARSMLRQWLVRRARPLVDGSGARAPAPAPADDGRYVLVVGPGRR